MLGSRVGVVNGLRAGLERNQGLDPWQRQNIFLSSPEGRDRRWGSPSFLLNKVGGSRPGFKVVGA